VCVREREGGRERVCVSVCVRVCVCVSNVFVSLDQEGIGDLNVYMCVSVCECVSE